MEQEGTKTQNEAWEWLKALLIALAVAGIVKIFLLTLIVVDGESMMPTLEDQDRMIVNKIGYTISGPDRFDIVVFNVEDGKKYIKRVIGLPGESVEYRNDQLYVNSEPIDEPYLEQGKAQILDGNLTGDFSFKDIPGVTTAEIPEGYILVMGDNRRNSKDSRHIGLVKQSDVIGTASIVFWPFKSMRIAK